MHRGSIATDSTAARSVDIVVGIVIVWLARFLIDDGIADLALGTGFADRFERFVAEWRMQRVAFEIFPAQAGLPDSRPSETVSGQRSDSRQ